MERRVLLFIAACACHKGASTDAGAASSASAAPIAASVTVDGGDIPTTHAMIQTAPWGVQLFVGEGSSCQEFESHVFMGHGRHVLVDFALRPRVLHEGISRVHLLVRDGTAYDLAST